jgi:1-acyl-sn-glycerol-3-phosphate acyltransferase
VAWFVRTVSLRWLRGKVRNGLDGLYVDGLDHVIETSRQGPIVVAATHDSWWDGLLAVWFCSTHDLRPTIVMDARNLVAYRFFEAHGVVGVDGLKGVREVLRRVQGPGDVLWIFPQGEYARHLDDLQRGAVWMAAKVDCPVVPLGVDYRLEHAENVRARMAFGPPVAADLEAMRDGMRAALDAARTADRPLLPATVVEANGATRFLSWIWSFA